MDYGYWTFWLLMTWFVIWYFSKYEPSFDWLRKLLNWIYKIKSAN